MLILCNSWPKAGTHVLLEFAHTILGNGSWYDEVDVKAPSGEMELFRNIDERIQRHRDDFAIKGHIPWSPSIEEGLLDRGFVILFIIRDPRDVLCSTYRWLMDLRPNWEISRFVRELKDDDERMMYVIKGLPLLQPFDLDFGIKWDKPLPERYELLTPWSESPRACFVRYERLTGFYGREEQLEEAARLVEAVGNVRDPALEEIVESLYSPKTLTFHTGESNTWTRYFTSEHRRLFVDLGGEALVERFGYVPTLRKDI